MKKVLVSLLVLALAMSSVFAAVNFNGEFVGGYNINYNPAGASKWSTHIMGQDGTGSNTTKLNLGFADEDGLWSVTAEGQMVADGRLQGDIKVDLFKLFGLENNMSLNLGLSMNDEQSILMAYADKSGNNYDRIRTAGPGLWANLDFKFGDFVEVLVAGAPKLKTPADDSETVGQVGGDFTVSAKVTPLNGLAVSAGWVLNGKDDNGTGTDGLIAAGADVNLADMIGLGFDLGVSASYKYGFGPKQNVVAATVYGGVDVVDAFVEYAYLSNDAQHYLMAQVNLNLVENMLLDVFAGAQDLGDFARTYFVGGDIGYTLSGVTFQLGLEYAAGEAQNYDLTGLSIVPQIKVAF